MALSIVPILIHSQAVPEEARDALRAASFGPPERREAELESAARVLATETDLDCSEARELVGLSTDGDCGCD
jgi:hypothetical protein